MSKTQIHCCFNMTIIDVYIKIILPFYYCLNVSYSEGVDLWAICHVRLRFLRTCYAIVVSDENASPPSMLRMDAAIINLFHLDWLKGRRMRKPLASEIGRSVTVVIMAPGKRERSVDLPVTREA